ncbi:endonuclease domain-containing protein [Microtetraspora niveoalba]|uniref:endonuclease domain-containing protein n=1 Tax=Microtetraspora niveoalba TaxID=46175 RepID=UPI000A068E5D
MKASGKLCEFEGCGRAHQAKGLCSAHYQQFVKSGNLTPLYEWLISPDARCGATPSCDRPVYTSSLCRTHYEQRKRGVPFAILKPLVNPEGTCAGPECKKEAEGEGRLCRSHTLIKRRGEALFPLILKTRSADLPDLIARGVYWCTSCQQELPLSAFVIDGQRKLPRSRCRLCLGIETRAEKHRRSFLEILTLFEYQNYTCATCVNRHTDDNGLHLDHDHRCCPKKGESCGKCIRGLLCWTCNAGALPWYERMRGIIEPVGLMESYLNHPPALLAGLISGKSFA